MTKIIVIERDNRIYNPDARDRYIGGDPCTSYDSARELVFAHVDWGCEVNVTFVENGYNYIELSRETGEIMKEWFVRQIEIPRI